MIKIDRKLLAGVPGERQATAVVASIMALARACGLLERARLLTLTGIGGVGKTRLALRAASEARRDFPDGVWLAELGDLHDGSLLVDVLAASLGVRDESARPIGRRGVGFSPEHGMGRRVHSEVASG